MALKVYDVSLEMIIAVRPLLTRISNRDRALADQLRRAASSVPLNIAEGSHSLGGNKRLRYQTAAGSASEASAALDVAQAWNYITTTQARPAQQTLDRLRAMLWRLTH